MSYRIYIEKQGKPYPFNRPETDGSLPKQPTISSKIKPIDVEDANSEVEKGEIILDPETGTMHKVLGKPHSKGGTPVSLKDGSFIFSNFKDLAINKNEKELFEFKDGGKYTIKNNTPAKVLGKEVDIEHHNKMIDILNNEKKFTNETINSAKLMMLKNFEKAGQVAYLQENKKNAAIPQFAQNTAPVYSKDVDEQITQSMQYLKFGGKFFPTYQPGGRKLTDKEIEEAEKNLLTDIKGWNFAFKTGPKSYYYKSNTTPYKGPMMGNDKWAAWLKTPKGQAYTAKQLNQFGYVKEAINIPPEGIKKINFKNLSPIKPLEPKLTLATQQKTVNSVGNPTGITDPTIQKVSLTPWQLFNMGLPFYKGMTVKTQYPIRQHQQSVVAQLDNLSVQPQLDANNQAYFNTVGLVGSDQGTAYAQDLWGKRIAANNQVYGNVQNANVQTQNQQKQLIANALNTDAAQNRAFDSNYYNGVQTAIKNTRDLKEAYFNQGMNISNDTISKKLAFESWLNSQSQYRGKKTYVDENGIQHYAGIPLYSPVAGFFGYSTKYNNPNIDWSTYQGSGNKIDSPDELGAAYQKLLEFMPGLTPDAFIKSRTLMNYNTNPNNIQQSLPPSFRRGGKFRIKKLR